MDKLIDDDAGAVPAADGTWFCVRAQPRREELAVRTLRTLPGVVSFCPRVRYLRRVRNRPRTFTVSLFPGYLFAKFVPDMSKQISYSLGVARIVRRGNELASVPLPVIDELLGISPYPECLLRLDDPAFKVGQKIRVIAGAFAGVEAKVTGLAPAKKRVAVLLEFLGQENEVTMDESAIDEIDSNPRRRAALVIANRKRMGNGE